MLDRSAAPEYLGDHAQFAAREISGIREKVVVSPCDGRFEPLPPDVFTAEGEWVEPAQVLARIRNGGDAVEVTTDFRGWLMGTLALPGQPVHRGEALFWIWSCS